jgi:hypothetical protein
MSRRPNLSYAAATKHQANVAKGTCQPSMDQHTMTSSPQKPYSLIDNWLIDSGCTIHMTPYIEDFIPELSPFQTMVETANGGLVEVSMKGTVKVLMNDTFQNNKTVMVYLNEVLHVPLLSRRLFSVAEWNRCGGTINFMMNRCRIEILGIDDQVINTIDVDPIYAEEAVNQQWVHTVRANLDMSKKVPIQQNLLHQRLGH